mgnify:CR=1 FL=1
MVRVLMAHTRACVLGWCALIALAACASLPAARPGDVILQDDFSDPQSGWDRHTGLDITTDYVDGAYLIAVAAGNLDAWGLAGLDLDDAQIEAEARHLAGPLDNAFGVLCRYTRTGDQNNFYFFLVSSDGYYSAGKVVKDEYTYLNPAGDFEPLAAVQTGPGAVNRLQAVCRGETLSLTVNGVAVGEFRDATLRHGDVGLIAGTFNEGGVQIAFDNVTVRQP